MTFIMLRKNKFLIAFSALLILTGCIEVTFPEAMPMNRCDKNHFPKSWQGDWTFSEQSDDVKEILSIHPQYVSFGTDQVVLGEENVLRKFAGYYILSSKSNNSQRWNLILAKRDKDVIHVYYFDGEDVEKAKIWEALLKDDTRNLFETIRKSDRIREYKLNPKNNRVFRELIKAGGLTHKGDYLR
tara:strand:+ start:158 stop:712 length:555 start_codon:yes stop_codon:yes gene_type:complete